MIFIYLQSFIHHFTGLFRTNIITSSQLAYQLSSQSTAPVLQRSWVQILCRPEFFFRPYFHCFLNKKCSLLPRSLSYSFLYPKFTYMTFTHLQSFTSHFTGLFGTNIMTSCQLANVSSVGRALHWYHRVHRFKSCTGLVFTTAQIVLITAKISFIFI